jgi:hypothetical protein
VVTNYFEAEVNQSEHILSSTGDLLMYQFFKVLGSFGVMKIVKLIFRGTVWLHGLKRSRMVLRYGHKHGA